MLKSLRSYSEDKGKERGNTNNLPVVLHHDEILLHISTEKMPCPSPFWILNT
jgi:hypothetical protein